MSEKRVQDNKAFFGQYKSQLGSMIQDMKEKLNNPAEDTIVSELNYQVERYSDFKSLNHGGMKKIWKVRDKSTGRPVAMASIKKDTTPERIQSFLREARITAQLQHPNIVPIHDIGLNEDNDPYFTMKLLDGENLAIIIEKLRVGDSAYLQKYPLAQLLSIYHKICDAVAYAHSKGIIHLDIKPENIQVSSYGEVLLCDWGLAKILDEACEESDIQRYSLDILDLENLTLDGYIKGTPGFMAPEQTSSTEGKKDKRTDIYALGALLYSILTYEKIIDTKDIKIYVEKALKGEIIAPKKLKPAMNIPTALEAVSMKALELKPDKRYQKVSEVISEIKAFEQGFATEAEEAGIFKTILLLFKRHKTISSLSIIFIIIALLATNTFISSLKQKEEKTQKALTALQVEQAKREKLSSLMAHEFLEDSQEALQNKNYSQAIKMTQNALQLDSKNTLAKEKLAKLYLIERDFKKAQKLFNELNLSSLSQLSQDLNNKTLNHRETLELLKIIDDPQIYSHCKINYAKKLFQNTQESLNYLKEAILIDNPKLDKLQMSYDSENDILDLSDNRELTNLSSLKMLKIYGLKLSRTGIEDIKELYEIDGLKHLDLSHSKVKKINSSTTIDLDFLDISESKVKDLIALKKGQAKVKHLKLLGIFPLAWGEITRNKDIREITLYYGQKFPDIDKMTDRTFNFIEQPAGYELKKPKHPGKGDKRPPKHDIPPHRTKDGKRPPRHDDSFRPRPPHDSKLPPPF